MTHHVSDIEMKISNVNKGNTSSPINTWVNLFRSVHHNNKDMQFTKQASHLTLGSFPYHAATPTTPSGKSENWVRSL